MICYKAIVDIEMTSRGATLQEKVGLLLSALNARERSDNITESGVERIFEVTYDIIATSHFMIYPAWISFRMIKRGKYNAIARFQLLPLELVWKLDVLVKDFEKRLRLAGDNKTHFRVKVKQMSFKINHPIYRGIFEQLVEQGIPISQIENGNYLSIPMAIKVGARSIHLKPGLRLTGRDDHYSCNLEFTLSKFIVIEEFVIPDISDLSIKDNLDICSDEWIKWLEEKIEPFVHNIQREIFQWAEYKEISLSDNLRKIIDYPIRLKNRYPLITS